MKRIKNHLNAATTHILEFGSKKKWAALTAMLLWVPYGFAQLNLIKSINRTELINYWKSDSLFSQGNYDKALIFYKKCTPKNYLDVTWPVKKSLCYLLTDDTLGARTNFRKFVYAGGDYMQTSYIAQIPLLEFLTNDKRVLDQFYVNTEALENMDDNCLYPDVQKTLLEMREVDQLYRQGNGDPKVSLTTIDSINQVKLYSLVSQYGWLGYNEVGKSGENAAFLIIQHADRDVEFQKKVLNMMEIELYHKNILPQSFAMLYDRVMVNTNKKQLFGSQVELNENATAFVCKPLYSKSLVNAYRLYFGLGTIESYLELMNSKLK